MISKQEESRRTKRLIKIALGGSLLLLLIVAGITTTLQSMRPIRQLSSDSPKKIVIAFHQQVRMISDRAHTAPVGAGRYGYLAFAQTDPNAAPLSSAERKAAMHQLRICFQQMQAARKNGQSVISSAQCIAMQLAILDPKVEQDPFLAKLYYRSLSSSDRKLLRQTGLVELRGRSVFPDYNTLINLQGLQGDADTVARARELGLELGRLTSAEMGYGCLGDVYAGRRNWFSCFNEVNEARGLFGLAPDMVGLTDDEFAAIQRGIPGNKIDSCLVRSPDLTTQEGFGNFANCFHVIEYLGSQEEPDLIPLIHQDRFGEGVLPEYLEGLLTPSDLPLISDASLLDYTHYCIDYALGKFTANAKPAGEVNFVMNMTCGQLLWVRESSELTALAGLPDPDLLELIVSQGDSRRRFHQDPLRRDGPGLGLGRVQAVGY